jgi:hypothetical protein
MKMPRISLLFTALLFSICSLAQGTIKGIVVDEESKLPLEGASVFAQNTTLGAVTKGDGSFTLNLSKGGYELVISFTGYISKRITVEAAGDKNLDIALQKEDKSLSEVVITNTYEVADGWEKHGQFFLSNFIGTTPLADSTVLLNPEVLKFYYYKRSDKLKVLATEPLRIQNKGLGYTLHYAIDSFVYYNKTALASYRGNCFYTAMDGTPEQQTAWQAARIKAYKGSRLHFLRSYYDSTLKTEGFTVDIASSTTRNKFDRLSNPYDTAYYYAHTETADVDLWFPAKVSITYTKAKPEATYLQQMKLPADVPVQISYVDLMESILIKPNGYFLEQRSWINQGYWSWKNLADQLPYDFEPTE